MELASVYYLLFIIYFTKFGACDSKFEHISDCVYARILERKPGTDWLTFKCNEVDHEQDIFLQDKFHCSYHPVNHSEYAFYPGTIKFENCRFNQIHIDFFAKFPNIHTFNISDIELETLQIGTFSGAKILTNLFVANNQLSEIQSGVFFAAKNLEVADFACNNIKSVDTFAFKDAKILETLNLSQNAITKLDEYMFVDLINLKELNLSHNKINEFDFSALPMNLMILDLSNNNISNLERTFTKIAKLKHLNLAFNPLANLNIGAFAKVPYLEYLNLRQTHLSAIPLATFSHQQKLVSLDLSENYLKKLDFKMFELILPDLESLHLNGNRLKDLHGFASELFPQLHVFDIRGNNFNCSYLLQFMKSISSEKLHIPVAPETIKTGDTHVQGIKCKSRDEVMELQNHDNVTEGDEATEGHEATEGPTQDIQLHGNDMKDNGAKSTRECHNSLYLIIAGIAFISSIFFYCYGLFKIFGQLKSNNLVPEVSIPHEMISERPMMLNI
ncbi:leucine-rich repeat-containing protein 15-like [Sitodiplosis mosellana]|uniref:leucine-rich repeat-containing protein 15-like n=1 Tax=Sitodiplosis mosellana TaxID=263140 RepID=UPI002444E210|nr:leucine-rich repeat-containing protein 15-like [Sitodiplosis mosellana]